MMNQKVTMPGHYKHLRGFYALMAALIGLLSMAACGKSGPGFLSYEAVAQRAGPTQVQVGDWQLTLTRAQMVIGPLYFCSTQSASSDLCPQALNELLEQTTVDLMQPSPQGLGVIHGLSGVINTAYYNMGWSWFTTYHQPVPPGLGHSMILQWRAVHKEGKGIDFTAWVDIIPPVQGSRAIQGVKVNAQVNESTQRLTITANPSQWIAQIDYSAYLGQNISAVLLENTENQVFNVLLSAIRGAHRPVFQWQ